MRLDELFDELKKRRVVRVAIANAVVAIVAGILPPAVHAQSPETETLDTTPRPSAESASATAEAELVTVMFEDFSGGASAWQKQKLDRRETAYAIVPSGADSALEGVSRNAAAGFIRMIDAPAAGRGRVSWRWNTAASLTANDREREKKGDDYVARIFLTFGGDPFTRGTRGLAYVWAGQEPVGSVFANPYISDVMTIVLRSGNTKAGQWVVEERDYVADFQEAFGEPAPPLTAIAILVDSDDTGATAVARFDDFRIQVAP